MPALGFGTYQISGKTCEGAVLSAIQQGYRLIDTADMYGNEKAVGAAIKKSGVPREQLFVSSKVYPTGGYDATLAAFDASLSRLGFEYLDLYIIHWPGGGPENRKESWRAMEEILASKRARSIGVSNYLARHIQEILDEPSFQHAPHINQCELHPQCQWQELRAFCVLNKVQFMGYMPFGGDGAPLLRDKGIKAAAAAVAEGAGRPVTEAQLLVHFVKDICGAVAIPRSTKPERQLENAGLDGVTAATNDEVMEALAAMDADEHYDWDPNDVP
jgi:2,5-diketo-D-gluconate reductase A